MTKTSAADRLAGKMESDINYIKKTVEEIKNRQDRDFVTRTEFEPVKKVVYGLVSLTLVTVMGGILALLIQK